MKKHFELARSKAWGTVLMQAFVLLACAIGFQNAHAEREQGRKLYRKSIYPMAFALTLAEAAEAQNEWKTYCSNAPCVVNDDRETYLTSSTPYGTFHRWIWERLYSWYNSSTKQWTSAKVSGDIYWDCRYGFGDLDSYSGVCSRPTQEPDCDCEDPNHPPPQVGKPIYPSTGVEQHVEVDYQGGGGNHLRFVRTYRSDKNGWINNYQINGIDFGNANPPESSPNFACTPDIGNLSIGLGYYCYPYLGTGQANDFTVQRGSGRRLYFGNNVDLSPSTPNINDRVSKVTDSTGSAVGWKVYNAQDDSTELYGLNGRIRSITEKNGQVTAFTYSDANTPAAVAPYAGLLLRVTDAFNRQLNFTYDSKGRMATMADPAGGIYTYAYDEASSVVLPGRSPVGNLTSVTYPDGRKRIYWYNEQDKTGNVYLPFALTGITDENGARYATVKYDGLGRAVSTELAGTVQKYSVAYPKTKVTSTVTDPLGSVRTYNFQTVLGVVKSTGYSQPAGSGSAAATTSLTYDANGNVASSTDFNGNKTTYSHDLTRNLEIRRVEADGTPEARTITTEWHPTYRLPARIAEPMRITTNTYDAKGNLIGKSVQATGDANGSQGFGAAATGAARTWSYTYNDYDQVLTATDPRGSTISHSYDSQGNLATVTNAAGHVTTLSNYDANGRVGRIVDPNGLTTDLTYSPRGWLTGRKAGSELTTYDYDGVGQLKNVTNPDGSSIAYTYDDAHRLTDIADNAGNSIHYTLDAMGNRIKEEVKDPAGSLARQVMRVYDALNRLQQVTGGT